MLYGNGLAVILYVVDLQRTYYCALNCGHGHCSAFEEAFTSWWENVIILISFVKLK